MADGSLYVVRDDQDLTAEWLNTLLGDIHTRIRTIEAIKTELGLAISELTAVGLQRIDAVVSPLIEQAQQNVAEVEANLALVAQQIADILAGAVPAASVVESGTRVFVTPAQRTAIGQIAGIVDDLATKATAANSTLTGLLTVTGSLKLAGALSPPALTADANNYAPADLDKNSRLRVSANAERAITGIVAGADGRVLLVENASAYDLTLKAESASSTAANRLAMTQDFILPKNGGVATLVYDAGLARWLLAGASPVPALPIGAILQAASDPGSRYLPCTGLSYLSGSYPTLAPLMKPSYLPLAVRKTIAGGVSKLAFGGGLFAAFGADGSYQTSTDGISWTTRTNPYGASLPGALGYGAGLYVAAPTTSGGYYTSTDAVNWTLRTRPPPSFGFSTCLVYANGRYVLGGSTSSSLAYLGWSTDGIVWTAGVGPVGAGVSGLCYSATMSRWLAVTSNGITLWSDDNASNWSNGTVPAGTPSGVAFGAGRFVVTTDAGVYTSTTGTGSWSAVTDTNVAGKAFNGVIFDGGRFVAFGNSGLVVTSDDGLVWATMPSGVTTAINTVARASAAITSSLVVGGGSGLLSGLEQSTTQFVTPSIPGAASNLANYIRAL